MNTENPDWQEIAHQLRKPDGELGLKVAENMHKSNIEMTRAAIKGLELQPGDKVLEIGHGSAMHVQELFMQQPDIHYTGLEISNLMHTEAQKNNAEAMKTGQAEFFTYDGIQLPIAQNSLSKIFSVNTIYFWEDAEDFSRQLFASLANEGMLSLAFAEQKFMNQLPFVQYGFQTYEMEEVISLLEQVGFIKHSISNQEDLFPSNTGEPIKRPFSLVVMKKSLD